MTTTEPREPSAARAEAGWSLDLPEETSADDAVDEEPRREADQPRSPSEGGASTDVERNPDQGVRSGLEDSADAKEEEASD